MSEQKAKGIVQNLNRTLLKSIHNFEKALSKNPSLNKSRNNLELIKRLQKKFQNKLTDTGSFLFTER